MCQKYVNAVWKSLSWLCGVSRTQQPPTTNHPPWRPPPPAHFPLFFCHRQQWERHLALAHISGIWPKSASSRNPPSPPPLPLSWLSSNASARLFPARYAHLFLRAFSLLSHTIYCHFKAKHLRYLSPFSVSISFYGTQNVVDGKLIFLAFFGTDNRGVYKIRLNSEELLGNPES